MGCCGQWAGDSGVWHDRVSVLRPVDGQWLAGVGVGAAVAAVGGADVVVVAAAAAVADARPPVAEPRRDAEVQVRSLSVGTSNLSQHDGSSCEFAVKAKAWEGVEIERWK